MHFFQHHLIPDALLPAPPHSRCTSSSTTSFLAHTSAYNQNHVKVVLVSTPSRVCVCMCFCFLIQFFEQRRFIYICVYVYVYIHV